LTPFCTQPESSVARRICRNVSSVFSVVVALGFALLVPVQAEGACGDYLSPSHRSIPGSVESDAHSSSANSRLPHGLPDHRSCNGPSCQSSPSQHPGTAPALTPDSHDGWIRVKEPVSLVEDLVSSTARLQQDVQLPTSPSRLDRPPK
jgi:hypothetical protein